MSQRHEQTGRTISNRIDRIAVDKSCASGRADNVPFKVRTDIGESDRAGLSFALLSGPLLNGALDLAQMLAAGAAVGCRAGLDVVRYGDGSQQSNDGGH